MGRTSLILLFSSLSLWSMPMLEIGLDEILTETSKQNLTIKQAKNSSEVAENSASLANAGLLPRLDLSSGSTLIKGINQTPGGEVDVENTSLTAGLNASYTLFNGMQGLSRYQLLNTQAEASELQSDMIEENILLSAASLYVNVLIRHDNLQISLEQLEISHQRLDQALEQTERGMASSLSALAARVDFDNDSVAVIESEYALQEAKRNLNLLIGWDLNQDYQPRSLSYELGNYNLQLLTSEGEKANKSHALNLNYEKQTDLNMKRTLGSVLPRVSLSGSYGLQQINSDVDFSFYNPDMTATAGLSLSWNLFDGMKSKSIQSGRLLQKNSQWNSLDSKRELEKSLSSALAYYEKSRQILELKANTLSSAQLNFDQTKEYFRLGQVSSTQFRDAQLNLSRAKSSQIQARYSAYLAEMSLWQLTGKLEAKIKHS
ncbi:MAG: TolC family protein [Candidatus Marinimicrobia bacterium]|jgi:outer membrane protein|nr:TolC family protein [Candidatus Neomarinimicrobiota bacterium]MBT3575975.1 TolC family protein [Candidatus Neomarinimicrobiota bacterium]MBT3679773.1 TolC family protein [Candidatus Neomarinimicrobiota bacterium]MBT3950438.1 TolC family protein [Candidatus Neomarinimicrobiota bacterium]MBT4253332.1 TolC family protein [Candidatus Neomarinimicrobiota bacterium]